MHYGCHSMVTPIKSVLLKHPQDAFVSQAHLEKHWRAFGYSECPDYRRALDEYALFEDLLGRYIPERLYLRGNESVGPDAIYTHDAVKITRNGAILMRMGKPLRSAEPALVKAFLRHRQIPVLGEIKPPGRMEGGDVVWLDDRTVALGLGYRTNPAGVDQFRRLAAGLVDAFMIVPLPHAGGPDQCLHLMSLISMLDHDLALVYSHYLPVVFRDRLRERGIDLIEVPDKEYPTLGGNVLTVAPKTCIALEGNPVTRKRLQDAGVVVHEFSGREIALKGTGGPTCLTCPLHRGDGPDMS